MLESLIELDKKVFFLINGNHNSVFDFIMYWISDDWIWLPFYLLLVFLIWKKVKKKTILIAITAILLFITTDQTSTLLKKSIERYRPSRDPMIENTVHIVNDHRGGKYGFISSHASNTFALAAFISMLGIAGLKWLNCVLFPWAILIGYSRIYLGVHYPGDILGGWLFAFICAFIFYCLYKFTERKIFSG